MPNLAELLGIDKENFRWQDLAACAGLDTELFYDRYDEDPILAAQADQVCYNCPVMRACFAAGRRNKEHGQWGGFYLNNGNIDNSRNSHKTKEELAMLKREHNL